jgi:hypothetical protein
MGAGRFGDVTNFRRRFFPKMHDLEAPGMARVQRCAASATLRVFQFRSHRFHEINTSIHRRVAARSKDWLRRDGGSPNQAVRSPVACFNSHCGGAGAVVAPRNGPRETAFIPRCLPSQGVLERIEWLAGRPKWGTGPVIGASRFLLSLPCDVRPSSRFRRTSALRRARISVSSARDRSWSGPSRGLITLDAGAVRRFARPASAQGEAARTSAANLPLRARPREKAGRCSPG